MTCSQCSKTAEPGAFATYRYKGEVRRRGVCKDCRNRRALVNYEAKQKWRREHNVKNKDNKRVRDAARRAEVKATIDKLKAETPCADCGRYFPPVAMDFDHVFGKNKGIASMVSGAYKLDLILEEIKLCEIVCACCHRVRTSLRKENRAPPSTSPVSTDGEPPKLG